MAKFMAISDIHGSVPEKDVAEKLVDEKYDALLLAGDVIEMNMKFKPLARWLKSVAENHRVIMTPGNHDYNIFEWYMIDHEGESFLSRRYPFIQRFSPEFLMENYGIEVLIDQGTTVDGVRIWGTPWSKNFCSWAFMDSTDKLKLKYDLIPKGIDVIVSHDPPTCLKPECDIDVNTEEYSVSGVKEHLGSTGLVSMLERVNPKYLLCGHIHSGDHKEHLIGKTKCYNVSYLNERYEPAYPVLEFEC